MQFRDQEEARAGRKSIPNREQMFYAVEWASKGVPNSIMLEKPFAPAQLVTAVANLLNSGTSTA
jgi:hypothetical protein